MSNIPSLDLNDFLSDDNNRKQDFVNAVEKHIKKLDFYPLKVIFYPKKI